MTAVSQWEREAIDKRMRNAMQHKRSNGQRVGNLACGDLSLADSKHLEVESTEQAALVQIRSLRQQGPSSRDSGGVERAGAAHPSRRSLAARSHTPHYQARVGYRIAEFRRQGASVSGSDNVLWIVSRHFRGLVKITGQSACTWTAA